MKVLQAVDGYARIELTRRNLETLLAKLDFNLDVPEATTRSECTIISGEDPIGQVRVKAVEDIEHYGDREPGAMLDNIRGEMF